jgi:hypothetical protein
VAGFAKVAVPKGQVMTVDVNILYDDIAFHDQVMAYRIPQGQYVFRAGLSSVTDTLAVNVSMPAM